MGVGNAAKNLGKKKNQSCWLRTVSITLIQSVGLVPLNQVVLSANDMDPEATLLLGHHTAVKRVATEHGLIVAELRNAVRHRLQIIVAPKHFAGMQIQLQLALGRHKYASTGATPSTLFKTRRAQGYAHHVAQQRIQLPLALRACQDLTQGAAQVMVGGQQSVLGHQVGRQLLLAGMCLFSGGEEA